MQEFQKNPIQEQMRLYDDVVYGETIEQLEYSVVWINKGKSAHEAGKPKQLIRVQLR